MLASTLPLLLFAAAMGWLLERQQRASTERGLRDTARALAVALDRELLASVSLARGLAASEHLDTGNLERFYDQAQRVLKANPRWLTVNLFDPSGQQLLNLLRPFGAPLPASPDLEVVRRARDTSEPAISDVFTGPVTGTSLVAIAVPVTREGRVIQVVGVGVDVRALSRLLAAGKLPSDWLATIIDRRGLIVARTRGIEQWLGQPASPEFVAHSRRAGEGSFRDVTRDGVGVHAAYSRSGVSGWTVAVGVPVDVVDAPGRRSLWAILGGGLTALLIAGAAAAVVGGRIARGMATLAPSGRGTATAAGASRIAEVEHAGRELAETAASFRLMFESNPLPMWVYDVETLGFLEVNVAAVQHYGYSRDEFLGMRLSDIRPPEDGPSLQDAVAHLVRAVTTAVRRYDTTWRHRLKDGRIRQVEILSHAIEFAGRRASLVVAIDVTELKEAETALSTYAERLRVLHEIDAAIIASEAPVAIAEAVLRPLRDLLGAPRAIVNLFDLERGEAEWLAAIGRRRLRLGPGVRFPLTLMGDVDALRRGELQVVDARRLPRGPAVDALLASGVELYMVVPMIAGGELIGAVSFGGAPGEFSEEQISIAREAAAQLAIAIAQARLHEQVKRQAQELEERVRERTRELTAANAETDRANQAKSEFLSRMSHELRTPLNAILGFGQLLEMRAEHPRDRESVEQILKGGHHLLTLINEVLDISRIESGRLSLSAEPVLVGEAVKRVIDLARPLADERGIGLEADASALLDRYVLADSQRLHQVLLNLVSNAIKYNRDGGRVTVACDDRGQGRLRITVTDTGPGIAPALQSRLFIPFDRLGVEARGVEGTGLGLALSRRLMEAMGGTIGLDSAEGRGSAFWIELAETVSPDQRSGLASSIEPRAAPFGEPAGTILYVEDNPSNLRLVERVLAEHTALRLIPAMQGRLGLALAREHHPDLILADLHLPDISGEDVLREVQADPALRGTPIVIVSADATPAQVKRLLAAGARAYLTKPIDVQELLAVIEAGLEARRAS